MVSVSPAVIWVLVDGMMFAPARCSCHFLVPAHVGGDRLLLNCFFLLFILAVNFIVRAFNIVIIHKCCCCSDLCCWIGHHRRAVHDILIYSKQDMCCCKIVLNNLLMLLWPRHTC